MSNSKEKQLKLKGIRIRKDSEDIKNLASIIPITYENIEKRLDRGADKFDAMDAKFTRYIFGLYVLIIVAAGVDRIFS